MRHFWKDPSVNAPKVALIAQSGSFACPYPGCAAHFDVMSGILNHLGTQHGLRVLWTKEPPQSGKRAQGKGDAEGDGDAATRSEKRYGPAKKKTGVTLAGTVRLYRDVEVGEACLAPQPS